MALLPERENAILHTAKVRDYLLNPDHPVGGSKAAFFAAFGFSQDKWHVMRDALIEHAKITEIVTTQQKKHGVTYNLEGALVSPDGRNPMIVSVWQIDTGTTLPRFITAFPAKNTR